MKWTLVMALLALAGCSKKSGRELPDARLPFIGQGGLVTTKQYELSSFRGKVMVLDVWATWCPPCRDALPLIEKKLANLAGEVELVSVCIDGHEKPTEARQMIRELAPTTLLLADDGSYAQKLGVTDIPHVFVVDREGVVVGDQSYQGTQRLERFLDETVSAARRR